ncbi:hypothetical protein SBV1_1710039 [Verrucomicrobia bacterium]|nr:hypothetical protein SBV1_1710039 [Verrucomicrobiota bacterium]
MIGRQTMKRSAPSPSPPVGGTLRLASGFRTGARHGWLLWLAVAAGCLLKAQAQEQEPRWVTLRLSNAYFVWDGEFEQQTISSSAGGSSVTIQRIYLAPAIGLEAMGSIYHPNLFAFTLAAEPGYAYQKIINSGGGSSASLTQNTVLQNYRANGTFFQTKPFSTTFFANAAHENIEYDIFNNAVLDTQGYGVSTGYRDGPVPVTLSYEKSHDDATSLGEETILDQQTLDFHARNERQDNNYTDLTYRYGEYDQTVKVPSSSFENDSSYQLATLLDTEHFGQNDRFGLNTTITYNQLDSANLPSKTFNAHSGLTMEMTPHLQGLLDYNFTGYSDSMSDYEQHFARAGLRHELYDSLTSGVDVHGGISHSGSDDSSVDTTTVGTLGILGYNKVLGGWGHLSVGNTAEYDVVDQSSSGGIVVIPNESHTLTAIPTPLNQPRVISIINVTDSTGTRPLQEGIDYTVDHGVDPWEIQLIPTSPIIHSGGTVLVTYEVQANPSGTYATFQDQFQARLDLFNRLLSFYARLNDIDNYTNTAGFVLENVVETQAGAEFNWHGLHLAGDYDDRHSSLHYSYTTESLAESYVLQSTPDSSFSIDLHQRWTDYPSQHQRATYYDFIGRFEWRPTAALTWTVEGGLEQQRGRGLDQDLAAARTHLDWKRGKLTVNLGYEYENQNFAGELRARHFVFLRAKRLF